MHGFIIVFVIFSFLDPSAAANYQFKHININKFMTSRVHRNSHKLSFIRERFQPFDTIYFPCSTIFNSALSQHELPLDLLNQFSSIVTLFCYVFTGSDFLLIFFFMILTFHNFSTIHFKIEHGIQFWMFSMTVQCQLITLNSLILRNWEILRKYLAKHENFQKKIFYSLISI